MGEIFGPDRTTAAQSAAEILLNKYPQQTEEILRYETGFPMLGIQPVPIESVEALRILWVTGKTFERILKGEKVNSFWWFEEPHDDTAGEGAWGDYYFTIPEGVRVSSRIRAWDPFVTRLAYPAWQKTVRELIGSKEERGSINAIDSDKYQERAREFGMMKIDTIEQIISRASGAQESYLIKLTNKNLG